MLSSKYWSWHQLCLLTNHENRRHGQKSIVTSSGLICFAKIDSNIRTEITRYMIATTNRGSYQGCLPCPYPCQFLNIKMYEHYPNVNLVRIWSEITNLDGQKFLLQSIANGSSNVRWSNGIPFQLPNPSLQQGGEICNNTLCVILRFSLKRKGKFSLIEYIFDQMLFYVVFCKYNTLICIICTGVLIFENTLPISVLCELEFVYL